jgi:hypothetical protein
MTLRRTTAALAAALTTVALATVPSSAQARVTGEWQDGRSDSDQIINCITQTLSTGTSANVGWRSADDRVPEVGEVFTLRGYIGLVSVPCGTGAVNVLPEILVPRGIEFAPGPVVWDLTRDGQAQDLGTDPLTIDGVSGRNGGVLIGEADGSPFQLRRGDVLEFQFPVYATRVLKGPATQRPECQDRIDGVRPCPVDQAGDHFQVGFIVDGHGGDKSYVTPYVGLFAAARTTDPGPDPVPAKAVSRTAATYVVSAKRPGTARVVVTSRTLPTGTVVVRDGRRTLARAALKASHRGRITLRLPRLAKGRHRLQVSYTGSTAVRPSTSPVRTITVR